MLRAVDLPDPEGPVIATNSPASMSRSIRSSARTIASCSPYTLVTARNDRSGSAAAARTGLSSTAAGIRLPSLRRHIHEDVGAGSKRAGCDLGQFSVGDPRAYRNAMERVSLEETEPGGVKWSAAFGTLITCFAEAVRMRIDAVIPGLSARSTLST